MLLFFVIFQIAENKHIDIFSGRLFPITIHFSGRLLQEIWENFSTVVLFITELLPLQETMILVTHFMNIQNILQLIDY